MSPAVPFLPPTPETPAAASVGFVLVRVEELSVERCLTLLSAAERTRVDAFRHERARAEHVVGRALLRTALGAELRVEPVAVPLEVAPNGRPYCPALQGVDFNLSHSHGLVLVAWGPMQLGVDVQRAERALADRATLAIVFAPEELAAFDVAPDPPALALRLWALKEAYLKALGHGLVEQPRSHPVRCLPPTGTAPSRAVAPRHPELTFLEPPLAEGHHVAFAIAHPQPTLRRVPLAELAPGLVRKEG